MCLIMPCQTLHNSMISSGRGCRVSQESVVALYEELTEYDWQAASKVTLLAFSVPQWLYLACSWHCGPEQSRISAVVGCLSNRCLLASGLSFKQQFPTHSVASLWRQMNLGHIDEREISLSLCVHVSGSHMAFRGCNCELRFRARWMAEGGCLAG